MRLSSPPVRTTTHEDQFDGELLLWAECTIQRTLRCGAAAFANFHLKSIRSGTSRILQWHSLNRKQSRFAAALKAADQAIALDEEDGEAQYERACALARLGRIKEAMSALEKAIELYPAQVEWMANEKDLKALAKLPAFKKLLPQPEKQ